MHKAQGRPAQQTDPVKQCLNFGNAEDENLRKNYAAMADETSRYKEELYTLRVENKKLNDQIQCSKKNFAALEDETRSYKEELYAFRVENKKLIDQIQHLNENYAALEDETGRYEEELLAFRVENNKLNDQIQWLRQRKESVNDPMMENTRLTDELDKLKSHIKELERDKQRFCLEAARLEKELKSVELEYRLERDESRQEVTRLNAKPKRICQKGEHLNQLVFLQYKNGKLTEQVKNLTEGVEYPKERLEIANKDNKGLTVQRDTFQKTVEEQKKLLQEIQKSHTHESYKQDQAKQRYQDEIDRANHKVQSLTSTGSELSDRLDEMHTARDHLEKNILKDQLAHVADQRPGEGSLSLNYHKELLNKKNEELAAVKRKLYSLEEQQNIGSKRLSDIEKENISLKKELSVTLQLLEESKEENRTIEKRYNVGNADYRNTISTMEMERNIEVTKLQDLINELRSELHNTKSTDEQEKSSIQHELSKIKEHNQQLDKDRHILGKEIYLLKEQKLELQKILQQAKEHVKDQQKLKEESLKKASTAANMDRKKIEERCKTETEKRMSLDKVCTELRNENERLQKDRNAVMSEVHKITAEKNQLAQKLVIDINAAKKEHEQLKTEKNDLIKFNEKSSSDKERISMLEQECETLTARQKPSDILLDPRSCRNCQNCNEIFDLKVEVSRLRDSNTIATSLPDPDRPANLGRRFSELFDEEWTEAINELHGDFRKNTNFLRDIVMKSFVFAQHTAQKYLDGLDVTILQINNKVQVKDPNIVKINKAHWLKTANYIALDLHESFASESCTYMRTGTGVRNFIKKVVPLCLKMILHDPPLALSAQEDGVIDPECYEPYNDSTREMTFIIWPALYLHEGGLILCKGVAGGME